MALLPIEKYYMAILSKEPLAETNPNNPLDLELDRLSLPNWENTSPLSHEFLDNVLPSNESIMVVMTLTNWSWEDLHHWSSFLPNKERVEYQLRDFKGHVNTAELTPNLKNLKIFFICHMRKCLKLTHRLLLTKWKPFKTILQKNVSWHTKCSNLWTSRWSLF